MDKSDKDFKMSHVQLIKVCKVLLHKLLTQDKKFTSLNEELQGTFSRENNQFQSRLESSVSQIHKTTHSLHSELDSVRAIVKQSQLESSSKSQKLGEIAKKTLDAVDEVKNSIARTGLIISCLAEYGAMVEAVAFDEGKNMLNSPSNASLPTTVKTKANSKRKSLGFGKSSDLNDTVGQMSRLEVNSSGLH